MTFKIEKAGKYVTEDGRKVIITAGLSGWSGRFKGNQLTHSWAADGAGPTLETRIVGRWKDRERKVKVEAAVADEGKRLEDGIVERVLAGLKPATEDRYKATVNLPPRPKPGPVFYCADLGTETPISPLKGRVEITGDVVWAVRRHGDDKLLYVRTTRGGAEFYADGNPADRYVVECRLAVIETPPTQGQKEG